MNITFNDIDLSQYIKVLDADRSLLPSVENSVTKVTTRSGGFFDWDRLEIREISVKYALITDDTERLQKLKRKLAGVLKTSEPKKLVFSDEPDVYYLAKLDSDTALDQTLGIAEGLLKFICIDPLAYSNKDKSITNSEDKNVLKVNYEGTADSLPVVSAKFNSECGYLALINGDGRIVQVGKPEELDKVTYQRNETAINEPFRSNNGKWKSNVGKLTYPNYGSYPNRQEGEYDWTTGEEVIIPNFQNSVPTDLKGWRGPSITQTIPPNSEGGADGNFLQKVRFDFIQSKNSELGRAEVTIQNKSGILAGFVLRDSTLDKKQYLFECWVNNKWVEVVELDPNQHKNGFFEVQIQKVGSQVSFQICNIVGFGTGSQTNDKVINRSYNIPEILGQSADTVTIWMGRLNNLSPLRMDWTDYKFIWINVDKVHDIPNQFQTDDELLIDFSTGQIFLNSVLNYSLGAVGNDFFSLEFGDNEIYITSSEWAENKPEIELTYREVYY